MQVHFFISDISGLNNGEKCKYTFFPEIFIVSVSSKKFTFVRINLTLINIIFSFRNNMLNNEKCSFHLESNNEDSQNKKIIIPNLYLYICSGTLYNCHSTIHIVVLWNKYSTSTLCNYNSWWWCLCFRPSQIVTIWVDWWIRWEQCYDILQQYAFHSKRLPIMIMGSFFYFSTISHSYLKCHGLKKENRMKCLAIFSAWNWTSGAAKLSSPHTYNNDNE